VLAIGPLGIGPFELLLILAVVVIIFGVGRLPEVGGAIGKSIREFRRTSQEPEKPQQQLSQPEVRSDLQSPASEAPPAAASTLSCPRCGSSNAATARFCSECGVSLTRCPHCGSSNAERAKFCSECGASLQAPVN
jgi:sec-independent protein translocase protein TatA